jgi:hypothetical protein
MGRQISAIGIVVLCWVLAACGLSNAPHTSLGQPGAPSSSYDEQAAINRKQAEDATHRLLGLAEIPPGAVELDSAPAALPGPALGTPASQTYASLARYWRVPLSFPAADTFVRAHPPAGLTEEGSSSGTEEGMIRHGYAWGGSAPGSAHGGHLSIGVAGPAAGQVSYLRIDAGSEWLDPHPVADDTTGPRLRIESDQGCPADDRAIVGVRNDGTGFDRALVPDGTPTGGRVCAYAGLNGHAFALLRQRAMSGGDAVRVVAAARSVELAHADVQTSCPMDDGMATVLVLHYPDRPAVDLWLEVTGCTSASNGSVRAIQSAGLAALLRIGRELSS